jgi:hypothetical protein
MAKVYAVEVSDREGDRTVDARRESTGDKHETNETRPGLPEKL